MSKQTIKEIITVGKAQTVNVPKGIPWSTTFVQLDAHANALTIDGGIRNFKYHKHIRS
jgi:hypothetical protein